MISVVARKGQPRIAVSTLAGSPAGDHAQDAQDARDELAPGQLGGKLVARLAVKLGHVGQANHLVAAFVAQGNPLLGRGERKGAHRNDATVAFPVGQGHDKSAKGIVAQTNGKRCGVVAHASPSSRSGRAGSNTRGGSGLPSSCPSCIWAW